MDIIIGLFIGSLFQLVKKNKKNLIGGNIIDNTKLISKLKAKISKTTKIYNATNLKLEEKELEIQINSLCGDVIGITAIDSILYDDDNEHFFIVMENEKIVGIFLGYIDESTPTILEVAYECSSVKGLGTIMRSLFFIEANQKYSVTKIKGGIVGGIPAINENDDIETTNKKRNKLIEYHQKRGAKIIKNNTGIYYEYDIVTIKNYIESMKN